MSIETAIDSLKYLKKWFSSGSTLEHYFNTELPYRGNSSDDISGWKAAYIKDWTRGVFGGLSYGEYKIYNKYKCIRKECVFGSCNQCGFYSYHNFNSGRKIFNERFGTVPLKVSHYRTIFIHEKGFRSEEQEILSVGISIKCSRFLCKKHSIGLRKTGNYFGAACINHHDYGSNFNNLSKLWGVRVEVIK